MKSETVRTAPLPPAPRDGNAFEEFQPQESALILLNLAVLGAVAIFHLTFHAALGRPTWILLLATALRFMEQAAEYAWLQKRSVPLSADATRRYAILSVWINIGVAFGIAMLGKQEDAHLRVLMVLPMIAAGFRFSNVALVAAVGVGSLLAFLEVAFHYGDSALSAAEYFEAATTMLIYIVVAVVVRSLAGQLKRDRRRLRESLAELQHTRDRLIEEEKLAAVGRLSAGLAHEIRNPVSLIISAMRRKDWGREPEMLRMVEEEAHRLESLTTDLLTYTRDRPPQTKDVAVDSLVGYVAALVEAQARERRIEVATCVPADVTAPVDQFQVHRALLNLVTNALAATSDGGRIELLGERRGPDWLALSVSNPGTPLSSEQVERLFEPFYTTRETGTGLGLPIARSIARAHGGDLVLGANRPGRIRFDLLLPLRTCPAPCPSGEPAHEPSSAD